MLIDRHDQHIVLLKTWNLELCFGSNVGTDQAKIEKILIPPILIEFVRPLVSAIRCEANKSNWWRRERPIGSCAIKMLNWSDLLLCTGGLAQHVAAANARSKVRARMHDWSACERDGSLENATCKLGKLNAWRGKSRLFRPFSSVSSVH